MNYLFLYTRIRASKLIKKYKTGFSLLYTTVFVFFAFLVFYFLFRFFLLDEALFNNIIIINDSQDGREVSDSIIAFAPEAWLGLLGLVLGTLIIVISVASQSTPKLIDLYTGDETSLYYIWYIVIGSVHNFFLQLLGGYTSAQLDSFHYLIVANELFNTYLMLPSALLLAVPYVLYILRYTKTSNVVEKIFSINLRRIRRLEARAALSLLDDPKIIEEYHLELFEALNQLDDLLEYVAFKEPKGDIINKISETIQAYISIKKNLENFPQFFKIGSRIGNDVSFKTMTGQFKEMERNRTFFEQKGFRLLGNAYIKLIEKDDFDLASLCAYELSECGRKAIEYQDKPLVDAVLIRFNTLLRFGIKHGLKNQEARNLYNAIFHYGAFIHHIIKFRDRDAIITSCRYLNNYVNEIYRHSRKEGAFVFLVDAFTWELKKILVELNRNEVDLDLQKTILDLFLQIDNLSDSYEDTSKGRSYSSGVRSLQIALALFYLKEGHLSLAEDIVEDILSDHEHMDKHLLRKMVADTCKRLSNQKETFWEETDRGNSNLYYSKDIDYVDTFLELFDNHLNGKSGSHSTLEPIKS